ncbi:aldo/keto reductase [Enterobacter adelaidei]
MKYQILGNTGVRVSSVALGTANFGMRWGYGASLDESRAILDAFAEDGGNFIDTADVYQFGESEEFLGGPPSGTQREFLSCDKIFERRI